MSYARQMLGSYPGDFKLDVDAEVLAGVIEAAADCAQACGTDTDADLSEPHRGRDGRVHPPVPGLRGYLRSYRSRAGPPGYLG